MNIEDAEARRIEDRLRQDNAVSHDDSRVGLKLTEPLLVHWVFQTFGREYGQPSGFGDLMHRRFTQSHAATGRARRLAIDRHDFVARFEERLKRRHGEIWRAHEDNAHGLAS